MNRTGSYTEKTTRPLLKTRGHFPSPDAATELPYLVLRNITRRWRNPAPDS